MDKQEEIFYAIKALGEKVKTLSGFVQNDFDRLIEDGYVTADELRLSIQDVNDQFESAANELNALRENVLLCLNAAIRKALREGVGIDAAAVGRPSARSYK